MNPLGMVVALLDAMDHAAVLEPSNKREINRFTGHCKEAVYAAFREGRGARDLSGPTGLTTEQFVDSVAEGPTRHMASGEVLTPCAPGRLLFFAAGAACLCAQIGALAL